MIRDARTAEREAESAISAFGSGALDLPIDLGTGAGSTLSWSGSHRPSTCVELYRKSPDRTAFDIVVSALVDDSAVLGCTLIENACLHAYALDGTTTPKAFRIVRPPRRDTPSTPMPLAVPAKAAGAAPSLVDEIQALSGLTLEEIAPLAGVSRRSLQNWRAGEPISARKEQRLRALTDTLRVLSKDDALATRCFLLNPIEGGLRPFDLLAEGRFDAALALGGHSTRPAMSSAGTAVVPPPAASMLARLSSRDEGPTGLDGRVDLRRSRRLKR